MLPRMSKSLLLIMLSGVLSPVAVIARDDSDKVSHSQSDAELISLSNFKHTVGKQRFDSLAALRSKELTDKSAAPTGNFRKNMVIERLQSRKVDMDTIPAIIFIDALRPDTVTVKCNVAQSDRKSHRSHRRQR